MRGDVLGVEYAMDKASPRMLKSSTIERDQGASRVEDI
jgi:hypothetical protein